MKFQFTPLSKLLPHLYNETLSATQLGGCSVDWEDDYEYGSW
jgi:hypothetical protein